MSEQPWLALSARPPLLRPEAVVGAAVPLWGYFAGAALMGVSWWWMTRWMQPAAWQAFTDAVVEPVTEALAEAAGGPLAEALMNAQDPVFPVGGEAAPFGPAVLEAELISDPALAADLTPSEPENPSNASN